MDEYRPVGCAIYSRYELAILRHETLRVHWQDPEGQSHLESLVPTDLQTREGEEFLHAMTLEGSRIRLRLDWIHSAQPLADEPLPA